MINNKITARSDLFIQGGNCVFWRRCVLDDTQAKDYVKGLGRKRKVEDIGLSDSMLF